MSLVLVVCFTCAARHVGDADDDNEDETVSHDKIPSAQSVNPGLCLHSENKTNS